MIMILFLIFGFSACSEGNGDTVNTNQSAPSIDCSATGECPQLTIVGDPPSIGMGTFHGHADSTLMLDPQASDRLWLAYSWLNITAGVDPDGTPVSMATVASHLARSDDGGLSFVFVDELYPSLPMTDPEGSGEEGMSNSETVSLAVMTSNGNPTWYGAHLRYFLRPITGYYPNYAASWTVRIGVAALPELLGAADTVANETIIGVSTTSDSYDPDVLLDQLAGLPIQHCAMINNPALFAQNGSLYLIVECLAFVGTAPDYDHSTIQVFGTTPTGDPRSWLWRHVGMLSDHSLALELDADTVLQPEVTLAADGTPLLIITPAVIDTSVQVGTHGRGCVAIALDSIDPPLIARDTQGRLIVKALINGDGFSACTYDNAAITGVLTHVQWQGHAYTIHKTGLKP